MARTFNGSTDRLQIDEAVVSNYPCSFACRFRKPAEHSFFQTFIFVNNSTAGGNYLELGVSGVDAGEPVGVWCRGATAETSVFSTTGTTPGTWHSAVAVFASATSRTIYLDGGSSATSATNAGALSGLNRTCVAVERFGTTNSFQFLGEIAEVGIWEVALSATDALALSKRISPSLIRPDGLVCYSNIFGRNSPEINTHGTNFTVTGTVVAEHPPGVIFRRRRPFFFVPTAAPPSGTAQRLIPDAVLSSTNLTGTGTIATIQDDPDSPDANKFTATSATAATDLRVSFFSPAADLVVGAAAQNFRLELNKTTGSPNPTVDVALWENGGLLATLLTGTSITSLTSQVIEATWNASLLALLSGVNVECRVVSTLGVGATPAYNSAGAATTNVTMPGARTCACPATVNAGDLLIAQIQVRNDNNDGSATCDDGTWTAFPGNPYGGANNSRQALFYKVADGTEDGASISFTAAGGTTNDLFHGRIYSFTAANGFAATPIVDVQTSSGTASPLGGPTTTPTGNNQLAVRMCAIASSDATIGSMTGESGGDWIDTVTSNTTVGGDGTLNIQASVQTTGAAISDGTIAFTTTTSAHWTTVGFALVPAVNTVEIGAIEWNALHEDVAPTPGTKGRLLLLGVG